MKKLPLPGGGGFCRLTVAMCEGEKEGTRPGEKCTGEVWLQNNRKTLRYHVLGTERGRPDGTFWTCTAAGFSLNMCNTWRWCLCHLHFGLLWSVSQCSQQIELGNRIWQILVMKKEKASGCTNMKHTVQHTHTRTHMQTHGPLLTSLC